MVDVELRRLRYFVAVAEELHFGAAARRELVTQQTLSRAIAQLERDVGRRLLIRSTRRVALTEAGEAMLAPARRALQAAAEAVNAAQGSTASPVLRVDISSGGIDTGATILRQVTCEYPDLAVHQVEVGVSRGLQLLREGRLDIVLGSAPADLVGVQAERIRREPVVVGVAKDHRWAGRSRVAVRELAGVPMLLPSAESAGEWRAFVAAFCQEAGFEPTAWKHITHGSAAAADAVRRGCVVPTMTWTDPPADLVFVPLHPAPVFTWSVMWPAGQGRQAPIQAFRRSARRAGASAGWLSSAKAEPRPAVTD